MYVLLFIRKEERRYKQVTKMVYVAWDSKLGGNDYEVSVSFDLEECRAAAVRDRERLSGSDRELCEHHIKGYTIDVLDGQSARVAYKEWALGHTVTPDAEYFEDVIIDDDYSVSTKVFRSNYQIWISRCRESVLSRLMTTDGLIYVSDEERYHEYINEGHEDDGDILTVAEAVEADVDVIRDALAELDIKPPESIIDKVREEIEFIYRGKTI